MEATRLSKHAAVVIMLWLSLTLNVSLLESVVVVDECKAGRTSAGVETSIKDDGGVDVGKSVS